MLNLQQAESMKRSWHRRAQSGQTEKETRWGRKQAWGAKTRAIADLLTTAIRGKWNSVLTTPGEQPWAGWWPADNTLADQAWGLMFGSLEQYKSWAGMAATWNSNTSEVETGDPGASRLSTLAGTASCGFSRRPYFSTWSRVKRDTQSQLWAYTYRQMHTSAYAKEQTVKQLRILQFCLYLF